MPLSEHVYCAAITFKMTKWVEQRICIKFCIKLEHSSVETLQRIQMTAAKGNWWLAASSGQHAHSYIMSYTEIFGKTSNHWGDSAPLQPIFGDLRLMTFPKTKITFENEEISTSMRFSKENTMGQLMAIERTVWGPKVPTLKGTEASLSYVQCCSYLLSSSVNVYFSYCVAWYFQDTPHRHTCGFLAGRQHWWERIWLGVWWEAQLKRPGRTSIDHVDSKNFGIRKDLKSSNWILTFYNLITTQITTF